MSKYAEMRSAMEPLGLYNLKGGSLVDCELLAYACVLERAQKRLDELLNSLWISTADDKTLLLWERRFGYTNQLSSASKRNKALKRMQNNRACGFDYGELYVHLSNAGYSGMMDNDSVHLTLRFNWQQQNNRIESFVKIIPIARSAAPAHLKLEINAPQSTWNESDAKNYSFYRWDAINLNWNINKEA